MGVFLRLVVYCTFTGPPPGLPHYVTRTMECLVSGVYLYLILIILSVMEMREGHSYYIIHGCRVRDLCEVA